MTLEYDNPLGQDADLLGTLSREVILVGTQNGTVVTHSGGSWTAVEGNLGPNAIVKQR